jgi:uncharacterized OB-fold protein
MSAQRRTHKLLPEPTPVSRPFWEAARKRVLSLQRCGKCADYIFYPRSLCPHCGGAELAWIEASGRGTVYSFTIARRPTMIGFQDEVPYVIAIVELDEGPRMTTNIVGCDPESVRIDMRVEAVFEDESDEITLVKFRPVESS